VTIHDHPRYFPVLIRSYPHLGYHGSHPFRTKSPVVHLGFIVLVRIDLLVSADACYLHYGMSAHLFPCLYHVSAPMDYFYLYISAFVKSRVYPDYKELCLVFIIHLLHPHRRSPISSNSSSSTTACHLLSPTSNPLVRIILYQAAVRKPSVHLGYTAESCALTSNPFPLGQRLYPSRVHLY
jgi:hypothetical protein